jgi:hypothetical protein
MKRILLLAAFCLGQAGWPPGAAAQLPNQPQLAQGSLRGTLVRVDKPLSGLIMRNEEGRQMAWRLDRSVIDVLATAKAGDPMWVIYREFGGGNRAVTAIGFPGATQKPVYVNATGSMVLLRTGAYVENQCRTGYPRAEDAVGNYRLRRGSSTEDAAPCWCCSPIEDSCEPANRAYEAGDKVTGRIVLARCYATSR